MNFPMWFGTRGYMTWVPCPTVGLDSSNEGYGAVTKFKNGGARVRRSKTTHKVYSLSWDMKKRDELRPILDYAAGVYGDGAIYWCDPFTMDRNVLPQHWAFPAQAGYDGPILDGRLVRPTIVSTPANSNSYPVESATFTVVAADAAKAEVFIPIPPGYTAWIGAHGAAGTGGTVRVAPATGATSRGSDVNLTLLAVTSTTRVNYSISSGSAIGLYLSLGGSGTITLSGLMVQLLPTGKSPLTGGYISGQGNSGCSFDPDISYTPYSAGMDLAGLSIDLIETEAWKNTPKSVLL